MTAEPIRQPDDETEEPPRPEGEPPRSDEPPRPDEPARPEEPPRPEGDANPESTHEPDAPSASESLTETATEAVTVPGENLTPEAAASAG